MGELRRSFCCTATSFGTTSWRALLNRECHVFCAYHPIPQEDCPDCLTTVASMRPTVFAELAAVELRSGIECCRRCEFVYYENVDRCPRCAEPHPFCLEPHFDAASTESDYRDQPVTDLGSLTLRELPGPQVGNATPRSARRTERR